MRGQKKEDQLNWHALCSSPCFFFFSALVQVLKWAIASHYSATNEMDALRKCPCLHTNRCDQVDVQGPLLRRQFGIGDKFDTGNIWHQGQFDTCGQFCTGGQLETKKIWHSCNWHQGNLETGQFGTCGQFGTRDNLAAVQFGPNCTATKLCGTICGTIWH